MQIMCNYCNKEIREGETNDIHLDRETGKVYLFHVACRQSAVDQSLERRAAPSSRRLTGQSGSRAKRRA
jgi:hypothetical protein